MKSGLLSTMFAGVLVLGLASFGSVFCGTSQADAEDFCAEHALCR